MLFHTVLNNKKTIYSDWLQDTVYNLGDSTFQIPDEYQYEILEVSEKYIARPDILSKEIYGDTIYILNDSMKLEPYIIEQIVKKVPLEARPEYTGNNWKQFEKICRENNFQVTRVFNTLRYVIVEYKLGHISNCISNYWVYDKKEKLLKKTFNNLSEYKKLSKS